MKYNFFLAVGINETSYLFFLCAGICWHINNLFYGYNYYYLMEYFLFYHSYF